MSPERVSEHALAKPGAWSDQPWEGDYVAKVSDGHGGGKIFAFLGATTVGVKAKQGQPVPRLRDSDAGSHAAGLAGMPSGDLAQLIQDLTDQMKAAAGELQFELAARLRDEISDLKKELRQMVEASR